MVTKTHIATPGGAGVFFVVAAMCVPYEMNCLKILKPSPAFENITLLAEKTISRGNEPNKSNSHLFLLHRTIALQRAEKNEHNEQEQLQRLFSI